MAAVTPTKPLPCASGVRPGFVYLSFPSIFSAGAHPVVFCL